MKFDLILCDKDKAELTRETHHIGGFSDITPDLLENATGRGMALADTHRRATICSFVFSPTDGRECLAVDISVPLQKKTPTRLWRQDAEIWRDMLMMRAKADGLLADA